MQGWRRMQDQHADDCGSRGGGRNDMLKLLPVIVTLPPLTFISCGVTAATLTSTTCTSGASAGAAAVGLATREARKVWGKMCIGVEMSTTLASRMWGFSWRGGGASVGEYVRAEV